MSDQHNLQEATPKSWGAWFADKVLPGLVGGSVTFLVLWAMDGLSAVAIVASNQIGQAWLPKGSLLLVAPDVECPDGDWLELGLILVGREKAKDGMFVEYFGEPLGKYQLQGWEQAKPKVCIKQ
jgi:hypothetical protein